MTPQERAEKIERMFPPALPDVLRKEFIEKVAAQIEEAEREAVSASVNTFSLTRQEVQRCFNEGWNAAKEEALGIAEECQEEYIRTGSILFKEIADRIGAMEPGE